MQQVTQTLHHQGRFRDISPLGKFCTAVLTSCLILTAGTSCTGAPQTSDADTIKIVATLFPQYDFACEVAGDKADVTLLLKPGTESHTYEPTPSDIAKINQSDVFIYTGDTMEPWVTRITSSIDSDVLVIDASKGITLKHEEEHEEHGEEDTHDEAYDPHVWLDLRNAQQMVDTIKEGLMQARQDDSDTFTANANAYNKKLAELDQRFADLVATSKRDTLVFGGPFAYLYFLDRYDLKYVTAYSSCSAEGDPSMADIAHVVDFIQTNRIPGIYYDPLESSTIAQSIATQCDIETLPFATGEFVSKDELEANTSFLELMQTNYTYVERGLNEN